ncbi:hypothetical protein ACFL3N_01615 [Candidatus Omnitrophota bacterium]
MKTNVHPLKLIVVKSAAVTPTLTGYPAIDPNQRTINRGYIVLTAIVDLVLGFEMSLDALRYSILRIINITFLNIKGYDTLGNKKVGNISLTNPCSVIY